MATEALGPLGKAPSYWHIDIYANRAEAENAKGPRGTVVESLGKVWFVHHRGERLAPLRW